MNDIIFLTCAACGTRFSPDGISGCSLCPLHGGCSQDDPASTKMVCCPNCGTQAVNPYASSWARWLSRLMKSERL